MTAGRMQVTEQAKLSRHGRKSTAAINNNNSVPLKSPKDSYMTLLVWSFQFFGRQLAIIAY